MEVFDKIVPIPNLSLALGFFDGVHLGHQKVVQAAVDEVGQSAVITFKESPAKFFSKEPIKYISTREERRAHIEALGVDYLFELDFTQELAQMTGEEYLRDILVKNFSPKKIVTGFDHTFGKSKSGTPKMLSEFQSELGYEYFLQTWDTDPEYPFSYGKVRLKGTHLMEAFSKNTKLHTYLL